MIDKSPSKSSSSSSSITTPPRQPHVGDALSYLEEVKRQYSTQSDVYNKFLDIMKAFKALTLTTTQVIAKVSILFKDQPQLIMGFNTFLPQGYSIKLSNNPTLQVTVMIPDGSIMNCITDQPAVDVVPPVSSAAPPIVSSPPPPPPVPAITNLQPTTALESRPFPLPAVVSDPLPPMNPVSSTPQPLVLPTITPVATPPILTSNASLSTTPASNNSLVPGLDSISSAALPLTSQGVDFGHAITYVNKLKTHFANQPEVYRQFLEILTNYQRETRPVEEVNERVQYLLKDAPHLIDEFKQFLPLATGMGRSVLMQSTTGNNSSSSTGNLSRQPQHQPHLAQSASSSPLGLPVMGDQFPDNRNPKAVHAASANSQQPTSQPTPAFMPTASKKRKQDIRQTSGPQAQKKKRDVPSSTNGQQHLLSQQNLSGRLVAVCEEMDLFDKIKVKINSTLVYGELLKIMNLYAQDAISRDQLIDRVEPFLATRAPDLFTQFKSVVGAEQSSSLTSPHPLLELKPDIAHMDPNLTPVDSTIHPVAKLYNHDPTDNPGPSYRHIRKSVPTGTCTGRDALCRSVLNDTYISHPPTHNDANTAESTTDNGLVQRRTVYEENLSRTEEERYEFDINIEANQTCIRLLEPIALHIQTVSDEDRARLNLPKNLGSKHPTILERVLKKLYGDMWAQVHDALVRSPGVAVALVLKRLKQKDEEWRRLKREFGKVWRESDAKNFYKALDFQGAALKEGARKFQVKNLLVDIETTYLEVKEKRAMGVLTKQHHMELSIHDPAVLCDVFDFVDQIMHDGAQQGSTASSSGSISGGGNNPFSKLRPFLEGLMLCDPAGPDAGEPPVVEEGSKQTNSSAFNSPRRRSARMHQLKPIVSVTFFGNNNIYLIIRLIHAIYQRFHAIKQRGIELVNNPHLLHTISPVAVDLGFQDAPADDVPLKEPAKFYPYMLELLVNVLKGQFDTVKFEEQVRSMFGTSAHHVFSMDRITNVIVKQIKEASSDKQTMDLIKLFSPRASAHTSLSHKYHSETHMRLKAEEVMGGDVYGAEHLYRFVLHFPSESTSNDSAARMLTVQMLTAHDYINCDEEKWTQYVEQYTSVTMNDISATTRDPSQSKIICGKSHIQPGIPFMPRTLRQVVKSVEARKSMGNDQIVTQDGLQLKICINTYRLYYVALTEDVFARIYPFKPRQQGHEAKCGTSSTKMNAWLDGVHGWNRDAVGDVDLIAQERTRRVHDWFTQGLPLRL